MWWGACLTSKPYDKINAIKISWDYPFKVAKNLLYRVLLCTFGEFSMGIWIKAVENLWCEVLLWSWWKVVQYIWWVRNPMGIGWIHLQLILAPPRPYSIENNNNNNASCYPQSELYPHLEYQVLWLFKWYVSFGPVGTYKSDILATAKVLFNVIPVQYL
jgi:hypothetical protein